MSNKLQTKREIMQKTFESKVIYVQLETLLEFLKAVDLTEDLVAALAVDWTEDSLAALVGDSDVVSHPLEDSAPHNLVRQCICFHFAHPESIYIVPCQPYKLAYSMDYIKM